MNGSEDPPKGDADERADISDALPLMTAAGTVDRDALLAVYERSAASDDDQPIRVTFCINHHLSKRLDRYLVDRVPFLSRTALQRLIDEEAVTVNGRIPKASTRLQHGDVVVAALPPPPSNEIAPEEIPLDILFEDDELIVINKQPGLIVHPARSHKSGTLINGLAWHFLHRSSGKLSEVGRDMARPGVVHRLDKHTSGVMVAAKTETAHWRLGSSLRSARRRSVTSRLSKGTLIHWPISSTFLSASTHRSASGMRCGSTTVASLHRPTTGRSNSSRASHSSSWNFARDARTRFAFTCHTLGIPWRATTCTAERTCASVMLEAPRMLLC